MFLNAGYREFEPLSTYVPVNHEKLHQQTAKHVLSAQLDSLQYHALPTSLLDVPAALSPITLSHTESHLWQYFYMAIIPCCVLNPKANPYQDIILRTAAFGGPESPLFHAIMSIAATQLNNLGDSRFQSSSWDYRHRALRGLRIQTVQYERGSLDIKGAGQMVAAALLLCFLDVS